MKQQQEFVNKTINEQIEQRLKYEEILKQNNELLAKQATLQDQLSNLQSKAYGFDAAKKFDLYKSNQQKNINAHEQHDPLRHKLDTQFEHQQGYNFWEKENKIGHSTKLDDLAKEKGLWVNNQDGNVHKLLNDIDRTGKANNNNVGGTYGSNYAGTGAGLGLNNKNSGSMSKYSPMILNNNNQNLVNNNQLNNSLNKGNQNNQNTYGRKY